MTGERKKIYDRAVWVNECVPYSAIEKTLKDAHINDAGFCDWLARDVGQYRLLTEIARRNPRRTEEIDALQRFQRAMRDAADWLLFDALPPTGGALIAERYWEVSGTYLHDEAEATQETLLLLQEVANDVERRITADKQKTGRRPEPHRAELYDKVCKRLRAHGMKASEARAMAAEILVLCRVVAPEGERGQGKLQARSRPNQSKYRA